MPSSPKSAPKKYKKASFNTEIRKKLGMTQAQLAVMFGVSPAFMNMVEAGKRSLRQEHNTMLAEIYLQFHELETGAQLGYRSLETKLFLNDAYKRILPGMKQQEQDYRSRITEMKKELAAMKEQARDAEHAIIVFTTAIDKVRETGKKNQDTARFMERLAFFKQQAYENLISSWEPQQAKLHSKIEAIAGEAKALRRYRTKVTREHNPFKK